MKTVYKIINTINGKAYIGCTRNFEDRINRHKIMLRNGTHYCKKLLDDYRIYGDVFEFIILEETNEGWTREIYWQKELLPEYNTLNFARRNRIHFEEPVRKGRPKTQTQDHINRRLASIGVRKPLSEETKKQMSEKRKLFWERKKAKE